MKPICSCWSPCRCHQWLLQNAAGSSDTVLPPGKGSWPLYKRRRPWGHSFNAHSHSTFSFWWEKLFAGSHTRLHWAGMKLSHPRISKVIVLAHYIMKKDTWEFNIQHTISTVRSRFVNCCWPCIEQSCKLQWCFYPLFLGVIDCLFSELEDEQGCVFVSHALGYITATKYGLTECELLDILTCDADVSTKNITAIDR